MALIFNGTDGKHEYYLDGVLTPSNTTILKDSGLIRFDGVPEHILEAARRRGSAVHQLCHFDNEGDLYHASVDDAYRPYLEAWQRCRRDRGITVLLCEHRIASRTHRVTGTLDLLCESDGDGWLLDYATGDPASCAKFLQTAGYLGMALEWQAEDRELARVLGRHSRWRRASVRLCRDGSFRFKEYEDAREYARFQILASAWHIRREYGGIVTTEDLAA
jgi:hypothetical protein